MGSSLIFRKLVQKFPQNATLEKLKFFKPKKKFGLNFFFLAEGILRFFRF